MMMKYFMIILLYLFLCGKDYLGKIERERLSDTNKAKERMAKSWLMFGKIDE